MLDSLLTVLPCDPVLTLGGMDEEVIIPLIAIAGGISIVIVGMMCKTARTISQTKAREATRSEIAAYVAEGSMSADDGAKLMGAEQSDFEKKIADAVSWGMLSADKAEKLIGAVRKRGVDDA